MNLTGTLLNVNYSAGPKPNQGVVITRDRANSADIWRMGVNNTWFLVGLSFSFYFSTKKFVKQFFIMYIGTNQLRPLESATVY